MGRAGVALLLLLLLPSLGLEMEVGKRALLLRYSRMASGWRARVSTGPPLPLLLLLLLEANGLPVLVAAAPKALGTLPSPAAKAAAPPPPPPLAPQGRVNTAMPVLGCPRMSHSANSCSRAPSAAAVEGAQVQQRRRMRVLHTPLRVPVTVGGRAAAAAAVAAAAGALVARLTASHLAACVTDKFCCQEIVRIGAYV